MKSTHATNSLQVIVGLGKTGLSCARYLSAQGFNLAITDSRQHPPGLDEIIETFPDTMLALGHFDKHLCLNAARIILSPGVSLQEPAIAEAIKAGVPIVGDVELFAHSTKTPIIGITGSNGKSTVTTLLGEMGKTANIDLCIGGNLGEPVLDLLQRPTPHAYVLELSSFQLETTASLNLFAAVILNLCEDHMDRYNSLGDYLHAKQRIYAHCRQPVINRDAPRTWKNLKLANPISFGLDTPPSANDFGLISSNGISYLAKGNKCLMPVHDMKMKGRHQIPNALSALALGEIAGVPMEAMLQTLRVFPGLKHRCQWITNIGGVDWYNDTKATNVGAALAAIEGLGHEISGKLVVIAGGQGKGADFSPLQNAMKKYVKHLVLIGEDAKLIEQALQSNVSMQHADNLKQAVTIAHETATTGDLVVLAPACASFDMFKNFEDRGDMFMKYVSALS